MSIGLSNVLTALLWALLAGVAVWFLTWPFRRRSLGALLASIVLAGTAAAIAAVLGSVHEMVLSMHEQTKAVLVAVVAGLIAAVTAGVAARRVMRDNQVLREAILELGEGRVPQADSTRLSTELAQARAELDRVARALAETRERERALEASRRELISWISHDLRTPLAGLRAMSEALEDGLVDDPARYYKQILASVDRLSGMVDDLFDLSRLQAGSYSHDVETICLADLVSDCLAGLEPLADAQQVQLAGVVGHGATVVGNGPELNRAITNVVANAIRHTRSPGRVEVRLDRVNQTDGTSGTDATSGTSGTSGIAATSGTNRIGGTSGIGGTGGTGALAEISVQDECGGIAEHDLPRVFDVGYRGEAARTPHAVNPAGAGLGLAITRAVVGAHGGTITVENAGDGCRFRLLLPVAPEGATNPDQSSSAIRSAARRAPSDPTGR